MEAVLPVLVSFTESRAVARKSWVIPGSPAAADEVNLKPMDPSRQVPPEHQLPKSTKTEVMLCPV